MANRAILLNTPFLTSDPWLLEGKLKEPGTDFMEVAEAAYKIPVPWLLCFQPEDIRPVNVPLETDADAPARAIEVGLPCTSVRQALKNMEQALPIFAAIAGHSKIGKPVLAKRHDLPAGDAVAVSRLESDRSDVHVGPCSL